MPFLDSSGHPTEGGADPMALSRFENWLGLILFQAMCLFVYSDCRRAKPELGDSKIA